MACSTPADLKPSASWSYPAWSAVTWSRRHSQRVLERIARREGRRISFLAPIRAASYRTLEILPIV